MRLDKDEDYPKTIKATAEEKAALKPIYLDGVDGIEVTFMNDDFEKKATKVYPIHVIAELAKKLTEEYCKGRSGRSVRCKSRNS